jgi:hypothetical protein
VLGRLLVACRDRPKAFDAVNEHLDKVPDAIELAIESSLDLAAGMAVDDRLHAVSAYGVHNPIRVVAGVGDKCSTTRMRDQRLCHRGIVLLARGQRDVDRSALGIDKGVELR